MFGVPFLISIVYFVVFVQFSSCFTNSLIGLLYGFPRVCFCRCGLSQKNVPDSERDGRLLAGESVSPHEYPWLAAVNTPSGSYTGSLISDRHVLTAASPFYGISADSITVSLGGHDRCANDHPLSTGVVQVLLHPGYSPTGRGVISDIALLKLRHAVQFSTAVAPICIPRYWSDESHKVAWISFWKDTGNSSNCTPRVATLPILPTETCYKVAHDAFMTPEKGCLGPVGVNNMLCSVNAGAPVMTRRSANIYRLVGVLSSTTSCDQQAGSLFTKVEQHSSWIHENIRYDCQCV